MKSRSALGQSPKRRGDRVKFDLLQRRRPTGVRQVDHIIRPEESKLKRLQQHGYRRLSRLKAMKRSSYLSDPFVPYPFPTFPQLAGKLVGLSYSHFGAHDSVQERDIGGDSGVEHVVRSL